MSNRPTPETDAIIRNAATADHPPTRIAATLTVKCEKLERERDEAREELRTAVQERHDFHWQLLDAVRAREDLQEIKEYGTEEINAAVELRQKLAQALVDLDNMQDQRDFAMKVIKRLEQERDEAREKLDEEMKWHHRTHKELVETQCKLLDIDYDKLKS